MACSKGLTKTALALLNSVQRSISGVTGATIFAGENILMGAKNRVRMDGRGLACWGADGIYMIVMHPRMRNSRGSSEGGKPPE